MTDLLSKPTDALYAVDSVEKRYQLIDQLLSAGEISDEFYQSGSLDRFRSTINGSDDSLVHILLGDRGGGGHAHRVSIESDMSDTAYSTSIIDDEDYPETPEEYHSLVKKAESKHDGLPKYKSTRVTGIVHTHPISGEAKEKDKGSSVFPEDWSAEQILTSILEVVDAPPETGHRTYDEKHNSIKVKGVSNGLPITVFLDTEGKIISGFPTQT